MTAETDLEGSPPKTWGGDLQTFPRASVLNEMVLFHTADEQTLAARTNFTHVADAVTRQYLKLGGVYRKQGWHRFLRFYYRDCAAATASIDRLLVRALVGS